MYAHSIRDQVLQSQVLQKELAQQRAALQASGSAIRGAEPRDPGEVQREVGVLYNRLSELGIVIGALEDRLQPVVSADAVERGDQASAGPACESQLGRSISEAAEQARLMIGRVHSLTNRLAL